MAQEMFRTYFLDTKILWGYHLSPCQYFRMSGFLLQGIFINTECQCIFHQYMTHFNGIENMYIQ